MTNCPKCGKIFARQNRPICDSCYKQDEEMFESARKFIKENPSSDMDDIVEETGATKKQLLRWVREGRLDLVLPEGEGLNCSKCGRPISTGRVCKKCAAQLQSSLGGIKTPKIDEPKKTSSVIRVTDRK